ncbi:MAG: 30S ribosome-binding factor RbfA [Planctomycetota bacterium]
MVALAVPERNPTVSGNRRERIARVIREEASRVILYELADPRIGFVTVTKVKVSGDLQSARVFLSVLGDEADRARRQGRPPCRRAASQDPPCPLAQLRARRVGGGRPARGGPHPRGPRHRR